MSRFFHGIMGYMPAHDLHHAIFVPGQDHRKGIDIPFYNPLYDFVIAE
jgi:hypothetical protein